MGDNNPEDPKIELARVQEKLKNSNQLKREMTRLHITLSDVTLERNQLHEKLEIEKQQSAFLQIALNESKDKLVQRNKHRRNLSIVSDIFFLISNILTGWGVNNLTSTPPNDTGHVLIAAGVLIFIVNVISSKILASGGDV